jgi:hypothetical protein
MSVSCVGTCSHCGSRRFWLSHTLSLQLDDGRLECLAHPAERYECERKGLTLAQASERGRLYRETFYVCRHCGRDGETIARQHASDDRLTFSVRGAMKWGWGSAAVVVPVLLWVGWWPGAVAFGSALLAAPAIAWRENRKFDKELAARGIPRPDAPGAVPVAPPATGCSPETVVGRPLPSESGKARAAGPCCDRPDWIEAYRVKDEDRVPCSACGRGRMLVSEHAIH